MLGDRSAITTTITMTGPVIWGVISSAAVSAQLLYAAPRSLCCASRNYRQHRERDMTCDVHHHHHHHRPQVKQQAASAGKAVEKPEFLDVSDDEDKEGRYVNADGVRLVGAGDEDYDSDAEVRCHTDGRCP
jgi:hypothetical protein